MVIFGDYHTHTIYSGKKFHIKHGKGTILENAFSAKQKGLNEIGITEHGINHRLYGVKQSYFAQMRNEIEIAKQKTGVNILLGVEANIISSQGDIDLSEEDIHYLDYIIVGFHKNVRPKSFGEFFKFFLPNHLHLKSKKDVKRNTLALMKAMDKYPIDIISHPGVGMPVDFKEVGEYAKKTNTLLELNGKRIAYTKRDVDILKKMNVKFILSSDAHRPNKVGNVNKGLNFAIRHNILEENIANMGKRPKFKKEV